MQKKYAIKIAALPAIALSATIIVWADNKTVSPKKPAVHSANATGSIPANTVNDNNRKAGKWIDSWATSFLSTTVMGSIQEAPSFYPF